MTENTIDTKTENSIGETSKVDLKTIGELRGMRFFVPAYQRGYRWTKDQVEELLDDIWELYKQPIEKKYCIQPLIIKPIKDKNNEDMYEVVDGQQRLTTIYIFLRLAQIKISEEKVFSIEYETRKDSADFLSNLSSETCENIKNIDYHFMGNAFQTMLKWVEKKFKDEKSTQTSIINHLNSCIIERVFFIWYPIPQDADSIEIFSRINMGKIPLTNAELIKALLMNSENFAPGTAEKRQAEISVLWDKIEQELHHDSLWYFLNGLDEREESQTRIDMIFRLLAEDFPEDFAEYLPEDEENKVSNDKKKNDTLYPFHFFYAILKEADKADKADKQKTNIHKENALKKIWDTTETLFEKMKSWYEDYSQYHMIGFLLAQGETISGIQELFNNSGKKETLKTLLEKMKNYYPKIKESEDELDVDSLVYEKTNTPKNSKIKAVLLMFNIATLICESDQQTRFPFDIYKKDNWDLEHIHATADDSADSDDTLGNLTLLSASINRSYHDDPFNEKRETIIECEKKGDYIPPCTRNVFLKYYTPAPTDTNTTTNNDDFWKDWYDNDKQNYIKAIKDTLKKFFGFKMTFLELLNKFKAEIPILQPNYEKGQLNKDTSVEICSKLLKDIKEAIDNNKPLDKIDKISVYGQIGDDNKFIPNLAGQLRLTTLFLLHLYAFWNDNSQKSFPKEFTDKLSRFFKKLLEKRGEIFKPNQPKPSDIIKNSSDFGYKSDSPVQEFALAVLDKIVDAEYFGDVNANANALSDALKKEGKDALIRFEFLNVKTLGSEGKNNFTDDKQLEEKEK